MLEETCDLYSIRPLTDDASSGGCSFCQVKCLFNTPTLSPNARRSNELPAFYVFTQIIHHDLVNTL